jgi:hypothetical protein
VLEAADDVGGRLCANVGEDQRLLQALPCLVVELLEQARAELGLEGLPLFESDSRRRRNKPPRWGSSAGWAGRAVLSPRSTTSCQVRAIERQVSVVASGCLGGFG